jgi:hypothetical protein
MKASELRIGNLVKYDNRIFEIDSIAKVFPTLNTSEFGIGVVDYNNIEPILLTEEWLLKFGFTLGYSKWGYDIPNWMFDLTAFIGIGLNGNKKWFNVYCINGEIKQILYSIHYVHQLQNLYFSLTGQELEYEQN